MQSVPPRRFLNLALLLAASLTAVSPGISTDEHLNSLPAVSRLYVFNPKGWNRNALNKVMETYQR